MPVTTTGIDATDCVIKLDNAAGVLTDISGSSNKVEIKLENGVAEFRPFGTAWKKRMVVGKDAPISLRVVFTKTAGEGWPLLRDWFTGSNDSPRTIQIDVPDSSIGSERYVAEVVLADANIPLDAGADEYVMVEASLKTDGALTYAAITS
jgi:hypothetical protein